ncbi:MAG TPA: M28 family metallopeptidase [Acidobacteriaceae bacterium]|nr:M28 family metallopeptidase [Acidobacteriaceae bacterium]
MLPSRLALLFASLALSAFAFTRAQSAPTSTLFGYRDFSAEQAKIDQQFLAVPDAKLAGQELKTLTAEPHVASTPEDYKTAEYVASKFKEAGLDTRIVPYKAWLNLPRQVSVEAWNAEGKLLIKGPVPEHVGGNDRWQNDPRVLPAFNGSSPSGDVTGQAVYANYCSPDDFDKLSGMGIDFKGKIVLCRYGANFRGVKVYVAQQHGAAGVLIYSDPADDGYFRGDMYPHGPWRPATAVQRGSVQYLFRYPGDALTPGVASTPDLPADKLLKPEEAANLPTIPSEPISWHDAAPILEALNGPDAPREWQGALPFTYHVGPGVKVHLLLKMDYQYRTIWDVIGTVDGATFPDEWVIAGNHRDAWVYGAVDPNSGTVAMLEAVHGVGALLKQGWKPKRRIVFCSWDGEEEGLIGSTEWAEEHATELRQHAAIYINSDSNERGYLFAEGSHSLEPLVNEVARSVNDPETNVSAWRRMQAWQLLNGTPDQRKEAATRSDLRIGALGSGSDFSAFLDHLGIASLGISYRGEDTGMGVYHSIYDDFYWYTHYSDSTFVYGRAMAQTDGKLVLRMADADVLPYDFAALADTLHVYARQLKALLKQQQTEATEQKTAHDLNAYALTSDPRHPTIAPSILAAPPPSLDFAPLDNALEALDKSAAHYNQARTQALGRSAVSAEQLRSLNQELAQAARKLTSRQGLPRRPWMQNLIYAPGWYTGYDVKTLPGVREAIEQRHYAEADPQIVLVAHAIDEEAAYVEHLAGELDRASNNTLSASNAN